VRTRGHADQSDGGPHRLHTARRVDGNDQNSAEEHCGKPRVVERKAETMEGRWQPASADAADSRDVINDDEWQPEMRKVQIESRAEVRGQPEQIKIPDRIG